MPIGNHDKIKVFDFLWRPRRDLNPCYRRERIGSTHNFKALLRIRMHRKESQQPQKTGYMLHRCSRKSHQRWQAFGRTRRHGCYGSTDPAYRLSTRRLRKNRAAVRSLDG